MSRYVPVRCQVCGGTGSFTTSSQYGFTVSRLCEPCSGRGWLYMWETEPLRVLGTR